MDKIKKIMKITIEIPNKFIDVSKGLLLAECKNQEDELHLDEISNILKETTEPIYVNQDTIEAVCGEEIGHMNMLCALFALSRIMKEKGY